MKFYLLRHLQSASRFAAVALIFGILPAQANEFEAPIRTLLAEKFHNWLNDAVLVKAVTDQNQSHSNLTQSDIDALDKQWRAEVGATSSPMIDKVLGNELSIFLQGIKENHGGLITEIIVMDNKGLNVGQSDISSDYWQGDEAKYQSTFLLGKGAIHISDVEEDESTQTFQSQLSTTLVDGADNPIGAITIGVNVEAL